MAGTSLFIISIFLGASSFGFGHGSIIDKNKQLVGADTHVNYCHAPFSDVAGRCLLIDNSMLGTWTELRDFCKGFDGDLVNLHDANLLYDIKVHLDDKGITDSSFWIGAYDLIEEDHWVWSWNNTDVHIHTPLFGVQGSYQEPSGGTRQNCAMLNKDYFYFVFDEDCNQPLSVICSAGDTNVGTSAQIDIPEDRTNRDCPEPFTMIGNSCLLVDALEPSTWAEQQKLCELLGGSLAKIDDANDHGALFDYLQEHDVRKSLWIGGNDIEHEGEWVWHDGSPMKMSTPFWGSDLYRIQEPAGDRDENCLALDYSDFYFFHDVSCDFHHGVVCQFDI